MVGFGYQHTINLIPPYALVDTIVVFKSDYFELTAVDVKVLSLSVLEWLYRVRKSVKGKSLKMIFHFELGSFPVFQFL